MKTLISKSALSLTALMITLLPLSLYAEETTAEVTETAAVEEVAAETAEVVEAVAETPAEVTEVIETAPEPAAVVPTAQNPNGPTVYIVPLGKEMNLKVSYEHPMVMEGGDHLKSIQMETTTGDFLGLKQFHHRSKSPTAEFLVNPELADFDEVVLVAQSTKHGEIKTTHVLEFTPQDDLPDHLHPQKRLEARLAKAKEVKERMAKEAAAKADKSKKKVKKEVVAEPAAEAAKAETPAPAPVKKKRFGLF